MNILKFNNIMKNNFMKEKVELLLKEENNNKNTYVACMALLEYINVKLLREHFKFELIDFNIMRIIEKYSKVDEILFDIMLSVNDDYNTIDLNNVEERNIEDLLYDIDFLCGHIQKKYGDAILR